MIDTDVMFDADRNRGGFAPRRQALLVAPTQDGPPILLRRPDYKIRRARVGPGYLLKFPGARRWVPVLDHPDYMPTLELRALHESVTEAGL